MFAAIRGIHRVAGPVAGLAILALLGVAVRLDAPRSRGAVVRSTRPVMGTLFEVAVWAPAERRPHAAEAARAALDAAAALEARVSSWRPESETSAVNRGAGGLPVPAGPDLRELLRAADAWSRRSGGAFDCTGGPLFDLWGEARRLRRVPSRAAVEARRALVGFAAVAVTAQGVRLPRSGMRLGFGGLAKGLAADRIAAQLRAAGFPDHLVDAGGDLVVGGTRGGTPWTVGVRRPGGGGVIATLDATNCAVATSGDYEQFFEAGGRRYSHIVDPRSGWPVQGTASVTVLSGSGLDADALATACAVLGRSAGLALVESLPGVEAVHIAPDGAVTCSSGVAVDGGRISWMR